MAYINILLLFVLTATSFAQTDSVLLYKIKAVKAGYEVFPQDNYLFAECKNKIKIVPTGVKRTIEVKLSTGSIKQTKADSIYIIDNLEGDRTLLSIYEITKSGSKKLILNKQYTIVPYPKINFGGVKCDSAIYKSLLAGGTMNAPYSKVKGNAKVISFKMDIREEGRFIQDSSSTNSLTPKMRNYVKSLRPGSIIYFKDIQYIGANGENQTIPIFRLFMIEEEEIYQFGF